MSEPDNKPYPFTLKQTLIGGYLIIAVLFAIYHANWGPMAFKGFAYNLGKCLFWPGLIFPSLNGVLTTLIIVAFVAFVMFFG